MISSRTSIVGFASYVDTSVYNLSSIVVVWFHQVGHELVRFPFRPWYRRKQEPSFANMLTTLRRVSYDEKTEPLLPEPSGLKTWLAQLTELLSRAG